MPRARLLEVHEEPGGLYEALLELDYEGRSYRLRIGRLLRPPARAAETRLRGEYLTIELRDEHGAPVATCCIHRGHLEQGCMECPSLVAPPHGYGEKT